MIAPMQTASRMGTVFSCCSALSSRLDYYSLVAASSIKSLLGNLVLVHGSRVALVEGNQSLTYRELSDAISEKADDLRDVRAQLGAHFFPLVVDRTLDSAVTILAALVERIPIGLIDSALPAERQKEHIARLQSGGPETNQGNLNSPRPWSTTNSEEDEVSSCQGYVVFTSGSTGRPKGVILSYETLEWRLHLLRQQKALQERARTIAHLKPFHFSAGLTLLAEVFMGDTVHLIDPRKYSVGDLWSYLSDARISYLSLAPSLARVLGRHRNPDKVRSVCHFVIGGEGANFELLDPFRDVFSPEALFVNQLGFTEGFRPLHYEILLTDAPKSGQIPVGTVTEADHVRLVTQNETNLDFEVWVSGPIAEGYLNDPKLTQERFVVHRNTRWWKSGDLLREVRPGVYRHAGRKDDLVKVSGVLTSPSETAQKILDFASVKAVVVLAEPSSGNRLVAHIEPQSGAKFDQEHLLRTLRQSLPSNQVPIEIVCWKSLPTMHGGKVDRLALRRGGEHSNC